MSMVKRIARNYIGKVFVRGADSVMLRCLGISKTKTERFV